MLFACSDYVSDNDKLNHDDHVPVSDGSTVTHAVQPDSSVAALKLMYTQAIAEFVKAVYQKDKTTFDTLYFGKHQYGQPDDFPAIELPDEIENTQIRLVHPAIGQHKQLEQKSLVYINMMSWMEEKQADFLLVVFSNGAEHQYDYSISYRRAAAEDQFVLHEISCEDYLHRKGNVPQHVVVYKDGKYVIGN